jgi:hypothetical protein
MSSVSVPDARRRRGRQQGALGGCRDHSHDLITTAASHGFTPAVRRQTCEID